MGADLANPAMIDGEPAGRAHRLSSAYRRLQYFREGGLVIALLITGVVFTLMNSVFATSQNFENIGSQITYEGVIAVSMTFVIITGEIDLSVGSMVGRQRRRLRADAQGRAVRCGRRSSSRSAPAAGSGRSNGILSVLLRVPTIIITLGMLSAYRGPRGPARERLSDLGLPRHRLVLGHRPEAAVRPRPVRRASC